MIFRLGYEQSTEILQARRIMYEERNSAPAHSLRRGFRYGLHWVVMAEFSAVTPHRGVSMACDLDGPAAIRCPSMSSISRA